MKKFNKILVQITIALLITTIFMALAVTLIGSPDAYAKYYDDFKWECGKEYYNITDKDGYEWYNAYFPIGEDGQLGSGDGGYAYFNNQSWGYENIYGVVNPKFMGESPKTCEQVQSVSHSGEMAEEVEEIDPIKKENEELKAENKEMSKLYEELTAQVAKITEVLSSLNL